MTKEFSIGYSSDWHLGTTKPSFPEKHRLFAMMEQAVDTTDAFVVLGDLVDRHTSSHINQAIEVLSRYRRSGKPLYFGFGNHEYYALPGEQVTDCDIDELKKRIGGETGALCYEGKVHYLDTGNRVVLTGVNGYIGQQPEQLWRKAQESSERIAIWNRYAESSYLPQVQSVLERVQDKEIAYMLFAMHYAPITQTQGVPSHEPLRGMSPAIPEAILTHAHFHPQTTVVIRHGHWHALDGFGRGELQGYMPYRDSMQQERTINVKNVSSVVLMREGYEYPMVIDTITPPI